MKLVDRGYKKIGITKLKTKKLEEKISNLIYYHVFYRDYYERQYRHNKRISTKACLAPPSLELVELTKFIVAWILGNLTNDLAWGVLKSAAEALKSKFIKISKKDLDGNFGKIVPEEGELRTYTKKIRRAILYPGKGLNKEVALSIFEEVEVDYRTAHFTKKQADTIYQTLVEGKDISSISHKHNVPQSYFRKKLVIRFSKNEIKPIIANLHRLEKTKVHSQSKKKK